MLILTAFLLRWFLNADRIFDVFVTADKLAKGFNKHAVLFGLSLIYIKAFKAKFLRFSH